MPKYRKKPVEINAAQLVPGNEDTLLTFMNETGCPFEIVGEPGGPMEMVIHTLEGDMHASEGDWIIQGVQGEFYPCKPDIFAATYDEVSA